MAKNQQLGTQAPSMPEWNLKLDLGTIGRNPPNFIVPIEVRVTQKGNAVPSTDVVLKRGVEEIAVKPTDDKGIVNFVFNPPLSDAGKNINLRVFLGNRIEEKSFNISLEEESKELSLDPEHLDVIGQVNNQTGMAVVSVTVTDEKGYGIKDRIVTFFFDLGEKQVTTNSEGHGLLEIPFLLTPGQELKVIVDVSGIRKKSKIILEREKALDLKEERKEKLNNRVCFSALLLSVAMWIVCFYVGFGDALISKPEVASSNWERHLWFWTFVLTLISIIYIPFAFKAEWTQAWKNIKEKFDDPATDSVGDPFLESTIDDIKNISTASKTNTSSIKVDEPARQGLKGKYGIGTLFSIDLLAEFVMELLPKIFLKIFKPK